MIKLTCPKCNLGLRVPEERVPAAGAWAQCPRCQERFFINPAGSSIADLTRPLGPGQSASPAPAARRRDQSSQRLLDRLKAKKGQTDEPEAEPALIIVYPEPAIPDYLYKAASVVMLCLPLLAVFLLFNSSDVGRNQPAATQLEPAATVIDHINDKDNPELIRKDLVNIKRDHTMRRRNLYGVDYSSQESRVFNYFMKRLAPGVCSGIDYLRVAPSNSNPPGFSATGLCLEPEGRRLEMRVDWVGQNSRISFPYNNSSEDFSLYLGRPGARVTRPGGSPDRRTEN